MPRSIGQRIKDWVAQQERAERMAKAAKIAEDYLGQPATHRTLTVVQMAQDHARTKIERETGAKVPRTVVSFSDDGTLTLTEQPASYGNRGE